MAAVDNFFFYEDEVFRVNSKGLMQFGTVIENSELVSSNDETSDDEYEGDYKMKKGHIRVAWHPSGLTEVISETKVGLADRSLMPGDVVKRLVKDKNTQRGYCSDIKVSATVQIVGTKLVIENLPTSQLAPLAEFSKDLAVYLDHWVGVIRDVHMKLLVLCTDGSKAYISDPSLLKTLMNQRKSKCLHEDFPRKSDFYPGQQLLAPRYVLSSAQWTYKSSEFEKLAARHKHLKLIVERMDVDFVDVTWRCTAFTGNTTQPCLTPRDSIVKGPDLDRLRVLNHFEACTMQVGDRVMFTPTLQHEILTMEAWREKKRDQILASGTPLPVHHKRKHSRRKTKKLASWNDAFPSKEPAETDLDSTLKDPNVEAQVTVNRISETTIAQGAGNQLNDTESNRDTKEVKDHDVPSIYFEFASEGDSEDWDTDNSQNASDFENSTSCCTTETSSVASSTRLNSESSRLNSESSNMDPLQNQEESLTSSLPALSPPVKRRSVALATRLMRRRNKAKQRARGKKSQTMAAFKDGIEMANVLSRQCVVEILCTQSFADVVWQDGSIEQNISSMDLYPIHYLDEKEFFPGDFVVEERVQMGEYGVVRQMDHVGRTAKIQWFVISHTDGESPQYKGEQEMSVYDIKDHPDFQFRPGSVVMNMGGVPAESGTSLIHGRLSDRRLASLSKALEGSQAKRGDPKPFTAEEERVYVGQVLDNFPEGRIKVYWVDGSISSVWPQDLYKIGDYNSDEGELWATSSEDSWETDDSLFDGDEETDYFSDAVEESNDQHPMTTSMYQDVHSILSRISKVTSDATAIAEAKNLLTCSVLAASVTSATSYADSTGITDATSISDSNNLTGLANIADPASGVAATYLNDKTRLADATNTADSSLISVTSRADLPSTVDATNAAKASTPGLNNTADASTPGLNNTADAKSPGLNNTAEASTPGLNNIADARTPSLNNIAEGASTPDLAISGGAIADATSTPDWAISGVERTKATSTPDLAISGVIAEATSTPDLAISGVERTEATNTPDGAISGAERTEATSTPDGAISGVERTEATSTPDGAISGVERTEATSTPDGAISVVERTEATSTPDGAISVVERTEASLFWAMLKLSHVMDVLMQAVEGSQGWQGGYREDLRATFKNLRCLDKLLGTNLFSNCQTQVESILSIMEAFESAELPTSVPSPSSASSHSTTHTRKISNESEQKINEENTVAKQDNDRANEDSATNIGETEEIIAGAEAASSLKKTMLAKRKVLASACEETMLSSSGETLAETSCKEPPLLVAASKESFLERASQKSSKKELLDSAKTGTCSASASKRELLETAGKKAVLASAGMIKASQKVFEEINEKDELVSLARRLEANLLLILSFAGRNSSESGPIRKLAKALRDANPLGHDPLGETSREEVSSATACKEALSQLRKFRSVLGQLNQLTEGQSKPTGSSPLESHSKLSAVTSNRNASGSSCNGSEIPTQLESIDLKASPSNTSSNSNDTNYCESRSKNCGNASAVQNSAERPILDPSLSSSTEDTVLTVLNEINETLQGECKALYLKLGSRCCSLLRFRLLLAHDQLIPKYFPEHKQLKLLGAADPQSSDNLPLYLNKKFQSNMKYMKQKLCPSSASADIKIDKDPTGENKPLDLSSADITTPSGEKKAVSAAGGEKKPVEKSIDAADKIGVESVKSSANNVKTTGNVNLEDSTVRSKVSSGKAGVDSVKPASDVEENLARSKVSSGKSAKEKKAERKEHKREVTKAVSECFDEEEDEKDTPGLITQDTSSGSERDPADPVATPVQILSTPENSTESFVMLDSLGSYAHRYAKRSFSVEGSQGKVFYKTLRKEMGLLRSSLPPGIWVRGFEDRLDLLSVMIEGPRATPYEDGLFYFDFQLPLDYPLTPPLVHYISYCSDRLNPNLYETGKVCVSLLGTWSGRGTEVWTAQSTLLQLLISIQGLILNSEPYYNEAGYERQRLSQHGQENARMYNELVLLKLIGAMESCAQRPPSVWAVETRRHFAERAHGFAARLEYWLNVSGEMTEGKKVVEEERRKVDEKERRKVDEKERRKVDEKGGERKKVDERQKVDVKEGERKKVDEKEEERQKVDEKEGERKKVVEEEEERNKVEMEVTEGERKKVDVKEGERKKVDVKEGERKKVDEKEEGGKKVEMEGDRKKGSEKEEQREKIGCEMGERKRGECEMKGGEEDMMEGVKRSRMEGGNCSGVNEEMEAGMSGSNDVESIVEVRRVLSESSGGENNAEGSKSQGGKNRGDSESRGSDESAGEVENISKCESNENTVNTASCDSTIICDKYVGNKNLDNHAKFSKLNESESSSVHQVETNAQHVNMSTNESNRVENSISTLGTNISVEVSNASNTVANAAKNFLSHPSASDQSQSNSVATQLDGLELPQFPLLPASRGFCLTLKSLIASFRKTMKALESQGERSESADGGAVTTEQVTHPEEVVLADTENVMTAESSETGDICVETVNNAESNVQLKVNSETCCNKKASDLNTACHNNTLGVKPCDNNSSESSVSCDENSANVNPPNNNSNVNASSNETSDNTPCTEARCCLSDQTKLSMSDQSLGSQLSTNEKSVHSISNQVGSDIFNSLETTNHTNKHKSLDHVNNNKI